MSLEDERQSKGELAIADRLALEELAIRWCELLDRTLYAALPDLFTDDGRYSLDGAWDRRGREELVAHYAQRASGDRIARHVTSNLILERVSADEVTGRGILTVYRWKGPGIGPAVPIAVQDFRDRYRRGADGRWRFSERVLMVVFGEEPNAAS